MFDQGEKLDNMLWVVMPVYNEESVIQQIVAEWIFALRKLEIEFTFCIINDGSTDQSLTVLRGLVLQYSEIKLVDRQQSGHGQSCFLGYVLGMDLGAEWFLQIDSDGQCDPKYLLEFWQKRTNNVLYGYRFRREDGYSRIMISKILSFIIWLKTSHYIKDANVPYRLFARSTAFNFVNTSQKTLDLYNVGLAIHHQRNFSISWIKIQFKQRTGGAKAFRLLQIAREGLRLLLQLRTI